MTAFAYYRWFTGDYVRDTRGLSLIQHGAYRQLLDCYMDNAAPLKGDVSRLCRMVGASSREECEAVQFALDQFFTFENGVYRHKRCDLEIAHSMARSTVASIAGKASAKARGHEPKEGRTDVEPTLNKGSTIQNQNQSQSQNQNHIKAKPREGEEAHHRRPPQKLEAPSEKHREMAEEFGIDCDFEFAKFRDWLDSNGRKQSNEAAGFRNWLRRAKQYRDERNAKPERELTLAERRVATMDALCGRGNARSIDGVARRVDSAVVFSIADAVRGSDGNDVGIDKPGGDERGVG